MAVGIALISIEPKKHLMNTLTTLNDGIGKITKKLVGKDLGAQMLRPLFLTYLDTQSPTTADREIIADCMLHSVATQMGRYTKRTAPRKRLGDDSEQSGQGRTKKARAQASSVPDF